MPAAEIQWYQDRIVGQVPKLRDHPAEKLALEEPQPMSSARMLYEKPIHTAEDVTRGLPIDDQSSWTKAIERAASVSPKETDFRRAIGLKLGMGQFSGELKRAILNRALSYYRGSMGTQVRVLSLAEAKKSLSVDLGELVAKSARAGGDISLLKSLVQAHGGRAIARELRTQGYSLRGRTLIKEPRFVLGTIVTDEMIKGAAAEVGEVRDWHGVRMQKIAPGHWVRVPKGRAKQGQGEEKEKPAIHGPFEASRKWSQKAPKGIRSYKEGGTQSTYSVVGEDGKRTYTKERKALHDHIVSEYLGSAQPVPEGKQPHAILMMGAPASGKTTMLKKSGLGQHNVVLVAGDEVKEKMPEYTAGVRAGYRGTAGMVHEESSDIAKRVRAEAMEQRKNIVFDGTGADAHKYTKFIKELKEKGYHVTLLMPHIDITEGKRRARARAERSGRWVPSDAVDSGYRNIPGNFFSVAQHVDSAQLYDNSKGPRVVWSKDQEGEKHVDPKFLSKFPNYPGAANAKDPDKARAKTE